MEISGLRIVHKQLEFETTGGKASYFEIRDLCKAFIKEENIEQGIMLVQSQHTTCSVFFEEFVHDRDVMGDDYLQFDLNKGLEKIFPKQLAYDDYYKYPGPIHRGMAMEDKEGEVAKNPSVLLNADAHLKASLLGSSKEFVIRDGELMIGQYGYIYFVDFDSNRPRKRKCNLCIIGQ